MAKLKEDERELVDKIVKAVAKRDMGIQDAITGALIDTNDRARRIYLRNILTKAVKAKMRYLARKTVAA